MCTPPFREALKISLKRPAQYSNGRRRRQPRRAEPSPRHRVMHDLDTGWGLANRPGAVDPLVGEERDPCSARTDDPLAIVFAVDLAAWLTWLEAARGAR